VRKPNIALIDDHNSVRKAYVMLLTEMEEFNIVFDAENFAELTSKLKQNRNIDVLLMDIKMPDKSGFEVASWMRENYPLVKVLALSSESDGFSIGKVLRNGAKGFVDKAANPTEILLAIQTVLAGDSYLSKKSFNAFSEVVQNSMDYFADQKPVFTDKETEFIKWACTGLSYKDIAAKMFISANSTDDYRNAVYKKLGVHTRQEIAVYAAKNNML
jgi:two-component system, NarL family, invasion response regulator UvrY